MRGPETRVRVVLNQSLETVFFLENRDLHSPLPISNPNQSNGSEL